MSAILHSDPPELTETNRHVPPALERIVRHCLEKNPAERFHSAHDVAFDLETLSSISSGTVSPQIKAGWKRQWQLAGMLALLVLVGGGIFFAGKHISQSAKPVRFNRISFERGLVVMASLRRMETLLSTTQLGMEIPSRLYSTPSNAPEPAAPRSERRKSFLPSRGLAKRRWVGRGGLFQPSPEVRGATLARSPLGGGAPRELLQEVQAAEWRRWHARGCSLCGRQGAVGSIRSAKFCTRPRLDRRTFAFLLRATKLLFSITVYWPDDRGFVSVVDIAGNKKQLTTEWESEDGLAWSPDGKESGLPRLRPDRTCAFCSYSFRQAAAAAQLSVNSAIVRCLFRWPCCCLRWARARQHDGRHS